MDDLLDLDFASAAPPAVSAANPQARYGASRSAFDYLAGSSPAGVLGAPARTPTPQTQRAPTPRAQPASGDAFSSLFGTSASPPPAGSGTAVSMAQRLQHDSAARVGGLGGAYSADGARGGLAAEAAGGSRAASPALQPAQRVASPSSSILNPTSRTVSPAATSLAPKAATKPADVWDFDLLSTAVPAATPPLPVPSASAPPPTPADDPFDLGFEAPVARFTSASEARAPPPAPADDFDLLDAFAAPASRLSSAAPPSPARPAPAHARPPRSTVSPASDPPPHILGQLVEMGFLPASASAALTASRSPTGEWDLDAALEALVNAQEAETRSREAEEWGDEDDVRVGRRRSWERDDGDDGAAAVEAARRRAQAQAPPQPERRHPTPADGDVPAPSSARAPRVDASQDPVLIAREQAKVLQEQAGEMLAHAQKLGFSMFKSANAYWGEGKKVLAKKLEEQRAATAGARSPGTGAQGAGPANGRPKWWTEEMDREEAAPAAKRTVPRDGAASQPSSFRDDDEEVVPAQPFAAPAPAPRREQQPRQAEPDAPTPSSEYRSPFRRAKAGAAPAPPPAVVEADLLFGAPPAHTPRSTPSLSLPASRPAAPPSRTSPVPRRPASTRPHIAVSASALSTAQTHKSTGNEHFKLGRFGEATAAYTRALDALPDSWLGRVPLLNNRAQARLRSGEEKAAAEDCAEAVAILLPAGGEADLPALEADGAALPVEVSALYPGAPLDLKDQLGKALGRRAKALEALEKWAAARDEWDRVLRLGNDAVLRGAGGANMVSDGVTRCRKMLDPPAAAPSPSPAPARPAAAAPAASRPKPRPPAAEVLGSGEAVRALQAQQAAAAAEDDERHALKDVVDTRVATWKGGKESNLRALIASLDTVLWPELGWKTVGMHELISEGQLKVRYVRAIAKLHPDKLNVSNTTVEQRMIAALVFAALNDAWNGMK